MVARLTRGVPRQFMAMLPLLLLLNGGQGRPDFSGQWTVDPERSGRVQSLGAQVLIRQTDPSLSLERGEGDAAIVTTYKLDGTISRNKTKSSIFKDGLPVDIVTSSVATWEGRQLRVETTSPSNDGKSSSQTIRILELESKDVLKVSTTTNSPGALPKTITFHKRVGLVREVYGR